MCVVMPSQLAAELALAQTQRLVLGGKVLQKLEGDLAVEVVETAEKSRVVDLQNRSQLADLGRDDDTGWVLPNLWPAVRASSQPIHPLVGRPALAGPDRPLAPVAVE